MGYLDELKKQAEDRRAQEEAEARRRAERERSYRAEILPRLESAFTYLSQLVEHLNYVKPEVNPEYLLQGYGPLEGLVQGDYSIKSDSRQNMKQIVVHYVCRGEGPVKFEVRERQAVQQMVDYLRSTGLPFNHREVLNNTYGVAAAQFEVKCEVPVTVALEADVDNSRVVLTLRNLDGFGVRRLHLAPAELDEPLLDRIARAIVREDLGLLRDDVPEETRRMLQQKIREEQARREAELRAAEEEAARRQAEEQRRRNRLAEALAARLKKVKGG